MSKRDWFYGVLSRLGLRKKKVAKLLIFGLVNSGKTTLFTLLTEEGQELMDLYPCDVPVCKEFSIGKTKLKAFDYGGLESACERDKKYLSKVSAVIYMVDAARKEWFGEARQDLAAILDNKSLAKVPFLILGNKIDQKKSAATENELVQSLDLASFRTGKGEADLGKSSVRPLEVFMCSVWEKLGYEEGLEWLLQYVR